MLAIPRKRAVAVGCALISLLSAATAHAATTFAPNRFDDPVAGGTNCAPPAPAGACSLRGAVLVANDGDTVQLAAGTYTLGLNQLNLTKTITIAGAGPSATTIRQTGPFRAINAVGVGLTMRGVTITGGSFVGINGPVGTGSPGD